mgnify:CR=1 FL=1
MSSSSSRAGFINPVRLNRYLARCGVASRRACEVLIEEGAVTVNSEVVTDLATMVEPDAQVRVNGIKVKPKPPQAVVLHKPRGLTCSQSDEQDKSTIYECLPPNLRHLQHVGRLDRDSEGLLVLTNDGELAQELAHPSMKVEKEYLVTLHEAVPNEVLDRLLSGVRITEGQVRFDAIGRVSARRVRVVLKQGYKRQVRRMFATLGLQVRKLMRIRVGSLWLDEELESGRWCFLEPADLSLLTQNPKKVDRSLFHKPSPGKGGAAAASKRAAIGRRKKSARLASEAAAKKKPSKRRRR